MKMKSKTVVFFGSGPVAARSLELLLNNFRVETVITKPRPSHHKGAVPVLDVAEKHNLPILTAQNKQELDHVVSENDFDSELAILIDFGIIVSKTVIDHFPLGIINSHFSLLPQLRGADPISFAILNGDQKTGVSLMVIDEGMDTGKLLTQKAFRLSPSITTPELTEELVSLSNKLIVEYLPKYISGEVAPRNQPHTDRATYSRKLTKADGVIDWNKPAEQIEREIRAFLGWPGSRTTLLGKDVIITKARAVNADGIPGTIEAAKNSNTLTIYCKQGRLEIEMLKPAGKREMSTKDFLAGLRI